MNHLVNRSVALRCVSSADQSPKLLSQDRLSQAIDEYYSLLDAGQEPDREQFLRKYADIAAELSDCLHNLDFIQNVAPQLAQNCDGQPDADTREIPSRVSLGDFRIIREIGRGGMGVVYEAEQVSLGRRMALKVLPFAAMLDKQRLTRFKNEARAAASLDHPNIVAVHSVGEERGVHYFAMQLVEGQSLAQIIAEMRKSRGLVADEGEVTSRPTMTFSGKAEKQSGIGFQPVETAPNHVGYHDRLEAYPTPGADTVRDLRAAVSTIPSFDSREYYRTVARLGEQAARALDHAHQNGIVHRDVKPGNLMVDGDGKLWVTDFGLARMEGEAGMTLSGDLLGTLAYMSPEQALAQRAVIDHRTDIYSLGATLYELLTLRPPYSGKDRQELLKKIAFEEPRKPHQFNSHIPHDLETIVNKSMEKDAVDRYKSAIELAEDLRRFLEDRPIVARPISLGIRARKWLRRHTSLVASIAAVSLLAVAGLTVSTVLVSRQSARAEQTLQLALSALEQTLAESVVGDLIVEPVDAKRTELERRGIQFYKEFARQNGTDPATWPTYRLLEFNQRLHRAYSLQSEDPQAAEVAFTDAISRAQQLVAATSGNPKNQARLIHCVNDFGKFLDDQGRREKASQQSRKAEQLADRLASEYPDFSTNSYLRGMLLYNRSKHHWDSHQLADAERYGRESLAFLEQAFAAEPNEIRVVYFLASCRYNLGMYLAEGGKNDAVENLWQKSLNDWRVLTLVRPVNSEYQSRAGATLSNLAVLARRRGDFKRCRELAQEALDHQKRALALKPVYELAKDFLGKHYQELSRAVEALGDYHALAKCAQDRAADLPDSPLENRVAAMALARCVRLAQKDEKLSIAERTDHMNRYTERALAVLDNAAGRFREESAIFMVGDAYSTVGDILAVAGRKDNAIKAWQAARQLVAGKPHVFDIHNFHQLSLAVESLADCDTLAACAEERVARLPDESFETCAAATSLAQCVLLARKDEKRPVAERTERMNDYAERAFTVLEDAVGRFGDDSARFMLADAYSTVGDLLGEAHRKNDLRRAWQAVRTLVVELQANAPSEKRHELDKLIKTADERLSKLTATK